MNRKQNNVYRMSTATLGLMEDHSELISPYAVITEQQAKIEALIKEIVIHKDGQIEGDTSGKTKSKNELLSQLTDRVSKVAKKTRALAKIVNDNDLLSRVDYSPYDIRDGSDQETLDTISIILKAAKEKESVLMESYNLAEGELAALEEMAEKVNGLVDTRKVKTSSGKTSTVNLSEAIKKTREEWNLMDDLIEGIVEDQDFIETYQHTRRIGR